MNEARRNAGDGEYQADQLLDHDYDGIEEYDNRLPNWWLWILYGSIIFALGYWLFFHTFGLGKLQAERYEKEMVAATKARLAMSGSELSDESLLLVSEIPERVEAGRQIFEQHCVACHGPQGQGLVGPNLTDDYWLHGASPMDIHAVISNGVVSKGMAAWGRQLGPSRVESVTAYVLSIKGTNVPGKEPQGERIEP